MFLDTTLQPYYTGFHKSAFIFNINLCFRFKHYVYRCAKKTDENQCSKLKAVTRP